MGIMATGTAEFPVRSSWIPGRGNRMVGNRMTAFDACQKSMTTGTEIVDRFGEHKTVIRGMGIMAGNTTLAENNTMHMRRPVLLLFAHQVCFVGMTAYTDVQRAFGPKLILIVAAVGVMTKGAPANHRPMSIFTEKPIFLTGMTGKTDIVDTGLRETDSPGINGLLVAGKALLIDGGTMLP